METLNSSTNFSSRLPKCGETIHGTSFKRDFGGKGGNQCIAATRLGAKTALVACLGDDIFGKEYLTHLRSEGVDTSNVSLIKGESCGIAQISVAENGDNQIIIVAGANNRLSIHEKLNDLLSQAKVVLCQFETPVIQTIQALKFCKHYNKSAITIVNAAPANVSVDPKLYSYTDILCVNESEAHLISGLPTSTKAECKDALMHLLTVLDSGMVILTLGRDGAMYVIREDMEVVYEPGTPVENPVDTTGAGDVFLGALAFLLVYRQMWDMRRKIKVACNVAAHSIMKRGTQASYPHVNDLPPEWLSN